MRRRADMATVPCGAEGQVGELEDSRGADNLQRLLRRLMLLLIAVGVLWRVGRYLLRFPLWTDEAFLCLNFLELDYLGLTRQLRNCQVAPLLFLWGELTALRLLGPSEWAMRLLPFLAGLGSLFLFWRLARLALPRLARTLAVGFLAVAVWPVSMGTFTKPYAFDLFASLLLLLPAVCWLRQPGRLRWPVLLTLATPLAVFSSYPVVFVAGAVSLALVGAWRQGSKARLLWCAYNAVLLASFLGHYRIAGQSQLRSPAHDAMTEQGRASSSDATTEEGMENSWSDGFPPGKPLALARWLLLAHTGQMMAFPIGSQDGGSALTTLLFLVGAWHFWKSRQRPLLVLCLAPFALSLAAAVLHRYPYGTSCRLCQHLAPAVCLGAGMGAAVLLERVRSVPARSRWIIAVCAVLVLIGLAGLAVDVLHPYRNVEALWTRQVMRDFAVRTRSGAPIAVLDQPEKVDALFRWYLEQYGARVWWGGRIDWDQARASGEVFCVHYDSLYLASPEQMPRAAWHGPLCVPPGLAVRSEPGGQSWILEEAFSDLGVPSNWHCPIRQLHQLHLVLK
jgi:hypothetical protein